MAISWSLAAGSAHGYAANEHLLEKYGDRVPVRENEWDNRHFWRVSNAEHLELTENCGIINLSHFAMYDIEGPDHVELMEWLCAAKIGGDANIGKGIYTHFLDDEGMVRADFTVIRMADRIRMINGADAGPRDFHYMRRVAEDKGFDVTITDVTEKYVTIGIWGPNARENLKKVVESPEGLDAENFPSLPSSQSGLRARMLPRSAFPMSVNRVGNCICVTKTALPSGMRFAPPA